MSEAIDSARELIGARLQELEQEAEGLKRALLSLGDKAPARRPGRPRRKTRRRSKAAKRAPRGQRREQFLAAVTASPGIKASEVAKQLGISPNQAYALARGLQKDRAIRKSGKGYLLAKEAKASK